jgi:FMN-dependent NADH-azoreductase
MPTILQIDASPRAASVSSHLASKFVAGLKKKDPATKVFHRNTTREKLPYVDEVVLNAFFSPADTLNADEKQVLALSDTLVDEFLAAEIVVFGVPMWNLGIPASLKAWVDLVSRAGRTFKYTPTGVETLVPAGKKVYVFEARGGAYPAGTPYEAYNQVDPYLRTIFAFFGITDVTIVHADNQSRSGDVAAQGVAAAEAQLAELLA